MNQSVIQPEIVILAGGKGTRLASVVTDVPKPLAPVLGRPFLDYLLNEIALSKLFLSVTLSLGHQAEKVIKHYETNQPRIPIHFVTEDSPLGTGGAARFAIQQMHSSSNTVFVLNGDSLVRIPFQELLSEHLNNAQATATLGLVKVPNAGRFGQVKTRGNGITAFLEKNPTSQPGLINSGVYVFNTQKFLESTQAYLEQFSLETDVFPSLVRNHTLFGKKMISPFIDIGLPETYSLASEFVREFRFE